MEQKEFERQMFLAYKQGALGALSHTCMNLMMMGEPKNDLNDEEYLKLVEKGPIDALQTGYRGCKGFIIEQLKKDIEAMEAVDTPDDKFFGKLHKMLGTVDQRKS